MNNAMKWGTLCTLNLTLKNRTAISCAFTSSAVTSSESSLARYEGDLVLSMPRDRWNGAACGSVKPSQLPSCRDALAKSRYDDHFKAALKRAKLFESQR